MLRYASTAENYFFLAKFGCHSEGIFPRADYTRQEGRSFQDDRVENLESMIISYPSRRNLSPM